MAIHKWEKYALVTTNDTITSQTGETVVVSSDPNSYVYCGDTVDCSQYIPSADWYYAVMSGSGYKYFKLNGVVYESENIWQSEEGLLSYCYKVTITTSYTKGSYIGEVTSESSSAYPTNGYSGSYWYVYIGEEETCGIFATVNGVQRELTAFPAMIDGVQRELSSLSATIDGVLRDIFSAGGSGGSGGSSGNALDSYTWAEISAIASAGQATERFSVGDAKTIVINGKVGNTTFTNLSIEVFIIGIDHNSSREGSNKIHFQIGMVDGVLAALVDSAYGTVKSSMGYFSMNPDSNSGGWAGSPMRNMLLGNAGTPTNVFADSLMAALPSDLRAVMKSVTKYTDNTGNKSDTSSNVTATTDYLFLLSEFEYHGVRTEANSYERNYQKQYDYYKTGNSKIHCRHDNAGTAVASWCRSLDVSTSYNFCRVTETGERSVGYSDGCYGIAPAFCV